MPEEYVPKRQKGRRFLTWWTLVMALVGWAFCLGQILSWELPWGFFVAWFVAFAVFLIGYWRFHESENG